MSKQSQGPGSANPYYNKVLYFFGKNIGRCLFLVLWRWTVKGRRNIPKTGTAVIFAANHRSLADPNLVGTAIPYPIHYFAKEELFQIPVIGWYIRRVNAFPVRRKDHDIGALRTAIDILSKKEGLLLFPEGGRRLDPARQFKAKAGVGMLACKTGAVVIPVGIMGNERLKTFAKVEIRFGKPMHPPKNPSRDDPQLFSDQIMEQIKELCQS